MAADIEEAAQNFVIASNNKESLAGDFTSDVLPRLAQLIGAADQLPRTRENCVLLQF
jgi:hypothetical protein